MNLLKTTNKWLNKNYSFYLIAVILLWIKTYIVYRLEFKLGIDNDLQKFLLFVNPISSSLFFLGIALFFKGKVRLWTMIAIEFILSFLLYANVVYYRFFNDFLTVPVLTQHGNFGQLGDSTLALMNGTDIFYFLDTFILIAIVLFKVVKTQSRIQRRGILSVFVFAIMIFAANLGLAEGDRPQLLSRTFDRNYLVKYLGAYNFSIYDIITSARSSAQRAFADSNDLTDIENFTKSNYTAPDQDLFGKAKGMNVIYVSMESLENFMVDEKLDGKYVMPFLHNLEKDQNTFYFDNFFHQVGQGKTSDAEFMMANSLFPLPQGAVFTQKASNTYQAQPQILANNGYTTATLHGNYKTFWNRDEMYKSLGIQKFFDANYYDMKDKNVINYGMKDKPMLKESMKYLEGLPQPFETKIITLSNHFPFELDKDDIDFPAADTSDTVVNKYFQTAHYMDEALEQFFNDLKKSGLYDNTVVVLYGDHYGISTNHNAGMQQIMGKKITAYENAQLQRVPLFIHVPGVKGGIKHTYGGEVDVRPTVLHLLGIDTKDYISFGSDLLSPEHREIVPFRNGDVMTPKFDSVGGKCYSNPDGTLVSKDNCSDATDFAKQALDLSDKVVYGDLLRFHDVKGFTPVDRSKIDYNSDQTVNTPVDPNSESTDKNDSTNTKDNKDK
ncbi:lipoteichoic acid synthase [Pullulanibacillus pueri]|uniref:Lipoteichoic acid synthase 2 n=1 Tax=Pullulanibacillus pueri TaxID=1437324 RepID=A0A8J2ZZS6_9BACL|nr:LTA synthase family protein [Pullulanibacillus pueri]MBM7683753.1 lipoteichoic acid synthase [Pullulanibacillus pueri]GGH87344.1 lipoteichoic acid synthase 2 [Pullulanibacillus pueri]